MESQKMEGLIQSINQPKILVVGDLILDKYIWGQVRRISPEAPIQIFSVDREEYRLGGAGNTFHNLITLGAEASCLGVVGEDEPGKKLRELILQLASEGPTIFTTPDRPTTIKSRLLAQNQQVIRIDRESNHKIPSSLQKEIADFVDENLAKFDLIVLSDYAKGLLAPPVLQELFQRAKERAIPVLVDPKGENYLRYKGASAITPNLAEAEKATGIGYRGPESLKAMGDWLLENLELQAAVITLGSQGIYLQLKDGYFRSFPAKAKSVYDVTGAGDTVLASLAVAMASGFGYQDAVRFANISAGMAVEKLGAVPITLAEIRHRIQGQQRVADKILTLQAARNMIRENREKGKKIVLTNGCFDLLHQGHVQYLHYAKNQGDLLIIALNSDKSIQTIKGENRPFLPIEVRSSLLAALEMVDVVVIFDEPTPLKVIQTLKPHILVKGEDYRHKIVVGREVVEARGGRVEFAPLLEGYSTTSLAKEISERFAKENKGSRRKWVEGEKEGQ